MRMLYMNVLIKAMKLKGEVTNVSGDDTRAQSPFEDDGINVI